MPLKSQIQNARTVLHGNNGEDETSLRRCPHFLLLGLAKKPTETHQYVRGSPKVNVWCGLLYDRVVGPFFFTETSITANIYQDLLEIYVFPQIDDLEAVTGNSIVFMQDGATPHFSISVREALNERFPNSWIRRDGPITWPARIPDLTPVDFFFWDSLCAVKTLLISAT
ncbi:hypothetical protein AVEN_229575-1 [Araneus ventricosus]|uniref:Tc1-like transposase DDE domain-containing protein n=1 Tax=Araneus ventricosus TaxID=182803 RepID=A0A4Y2GGQ2_ARAVE|nr:hypothetical protein AVEN_229575-1 [Araneus ventricosus]